jgi:hypothetical protein
MGSLPRRLAAATLAAAALLGVAGSVTTASAAPATVRVFRAYGPNPVYAAPRAWAQAYAAGFTTDQCAQDNEVVSPGYWEVFVTCVS